MTTLLKTAVLALSMLFVSNAQAAPIPATSTSKLVSPQLGLYRSPVGFQITSGGSGWVHAEPPKGNKYIATLYKSPTAAQPGSVADQMRRDLSSKGSVVASAPATKAVTAASLTVRVDELQKEIPLDKYIQKWMKEYPRYGFDVLGSKPFVQNKQRGYVLDLVNREQGKQLRQVVFLKQKKAVILTCRDRIVSFQDNLKGCNKIIRSFEW
ncbi:MAG: hypothetical protein EOP05_22635 [Proteobacteria bacterium]|nr:MAG: hypothetical protein EOP05_22635 [Pseudomonadota bacterium]